MCEHIRVPYKRRKKEKEKVGYSIRSRSSPILVKQERREELSDLARQSVMSSE